MKYAEIIVDISSPNLDKTFTYEIPSELEAEIVPGTPVMIPFGKSNKLKKGYVVGVTDYCKATGFMYGIILNYENEIFGFLRRCALRGGTFVGGRSRCRRGGNPESVV